MTVSIFLCICVIALSLCVGFLIGMFINEKVNRTYILNISKINSEHNENISKIIDKTSSRLIKCLNHYEYENKKIIAKAFDEIIKRNDFGR